MKRYIVFLTIVIFIFTLIPQKSYAVDVTNKRLGGKDRFEVAINVSKQGWTQSDTVILANYLAFADALSATPLAYQENAPILLTHPDKLTGVTENEIKRLGAKKVIVVGGPPSVSDNVMNRLQQLGIQTERIGGHDRYEVSYNVSKKLKSTDTAVVAYGLVFSDALSIAPYAAKNGYPILLTKTNVLPPETEKALKENGITKTVVSGGEPSVGTAVYNKLPSPKRMGGKDRYEVSSNIANNLGFTSKNAFVATGLTFADALTGSVLAAKMDAPMLLTRPTSAPSSIVQTIKNKGITNLFVLGSTASISNDVVTILSGKEVQPPKPLQGITIMLDAGHGGSDPGAVYSGVYEKTLNMQFTQQLASKLTYRGAKILYTRQPNNDIYISLEDRVAMANSQKPNLFISLHHDSSTSASASGSSTHYSTYRPNVDTSGTYVVINGKKYPLVKEDPEKKLFYYQDGNTVKTISLNTVIAYDTDSPSKAATESKELANLMAQALSNGVSIENDGSSDHNLYVTRRTTMASVLLELGFGSNPDELKLLKDPNVQAKRAEQLASVIEAYYK